VPPISPVSQLWHTFASFMAAVLMASTAHAEQKRCDPGSEAACPEYTAPATTAVPGPSMDGSSYVLGEQETMLFRGATPPNGFMIQLYGNNGSCVVNDNGEAGPPGNMNNIPAGFLIEAGNTTGSSPGVPNPIFVTPPGYKPIGPVSIFCYQTANIAARAW
jgi:hypothetical protein